MTTTMIIIMTMIITTITIDKNEKNKQNSIDYLLKKLYYILIGLYRSISGMYMKINKNDKGGKTLVRN